MTLILQIAAGVFAGVFLANVAGAATSVLLQRRARTRRAKAVADELMRMARADADAAAAKAKKEGGYL